MLSVLACSPGWAAPYPEGGRATEWVQPDGTTLPLLVYGDEFYSRTTTKDGYTVIFEPMDNTYYYATKGADGQALVSTGVPAHLPPLQGLAKGLRERKETVAAIRKTNKGVYDGERATKWSARLLAAQLRRAGSTGLIPLPPSGGSGASVAAADVSVAAVTGSKVGLVILVQFPDDPATGASDAVNYPTTVEKITRYCNEVGYADNGNSGSIRDYFYDQSLGALTHTQLVTAIVTLPQPRNYYNYSDYPTNATVRSSSGATGRLLLTDAVAAVKATGYDFSSLSVDSGRRVLATSILFAGNDSGVWSKGLWPHAWYIPNINVGTTANPMYIYGYQCTNTSNNAPVIGTMCHELGHLLLNFPDLYDYDDDSEGVGNHCLMAAANHLNSGKTPGPINLYLKDICGWANLADITPAQSLDATLTSTGNVGYRIRKPGSLTEYFTIENRGTGDKWATYSPDKGIAIWHIDEAVDGNDDQEMTTALHYQVSIEQADGRFDLEDNTNRGDSTDFYDSSTVLFSNTTTPNANWWSGVASEISIQALSVAGASMNVRFGTGAPSTILSLSPTTQSVDAAGVTSTFSVTSNLTWTWSGYASWVTSSEATSQTGNQPFTYTVAPNTSTTSRTAVITLTSGALSATHTITQSGADDHGNGIANATVVSPNSATAGSIETPGDSDYFRIDVPNAEMLVVSTTGTTDTYGYLLASSGTQLASDDDAGFSTNFSISYAVTTGTYYVRVRAYDQTAGTGTYQFVSSFANFTLSASPSSRSAPAGGLNAAFSVTSNTTWTWTCDSAWVTSSEVASQTGDQSFSYSAAANATTSMRTAIITVTAGSLSATHTIVQDGADDHGNSTGNATVVAQSSTTSGNIASASDVDYFRVDITGRGMLVVNTTGTTNTYGDLFDSSGITLKSDDDTGPSTNFQFSQAVNAGTYYIRVRHFDTVAGIGTYQMVSTFTAMPNLAATQPAGWSDEIVVSKVTGTTTDGAGMLSIDPVYIDHAVINNGTLTTGGTFKTELYVDDVLRQTFTESALATGATVTRTDTSIGTLNAGTHTVRIKTDSAATISESDKTDNEYTRTFSITAASNNASLTSLVPSAGSLSPSFASGTLAYAVNVPNTTTSISVTPTVAQANATVKVNGTTVASGAASSLINVNVGTNTITTVATAQDLSMTRSYVLTVTRQSHVQSWRQQYFGTTTNTGNAADTADGDNDGVSNSLERSFGLDPTKADSQSLPQAQRVGNNLVITFTEPTGINGVAYGAVWSPSLAPGTWQALTDTGTGAVHTFSIPISSAGPMFMKVTATMAAP